MNFFRAIAAVVLAANVVPALAGGYPLYVTQDKVPGHNEWKIVAYNKGPSPVTVTPELITASNAKLTLDTRSAGGKTLEPGAREVLGSIAPEHTEQAITFDTRLRWVFGRALNRTNSASGFYRFPFPGDMGFDTLNTASWMPSSKQDTYAIDILMPEGTAVIAARGGMVIDVRGERDGDRVKAGSFPWYETDTSRLGNYVRVLHDDGTWAEYGHLQDASVAVTIGSLVEAGTQLGLSGKSGSAKQPNLRFQVMKPGNSMDAPNSIQPLFDQGPRGLSPANIGQPLGTSMDPGSLVQKKAGTDPLQIGVGRETDKPPVGIYEAKPAPRSHSKMSLPATKLVFGLAGAGLLAVVVAVAAIPTWRRKFRALLTRGNEVADVVEDAQAAQEAKEAAELPGKREGTLRPKPGYLLAQWETLFYSYLCLATPVGYSVHAKVSLNRLLNRPLSLRSDREVYVGLRWEAIDFVIVRESDQRVLLAIGIDDASPLSATYERIHAAKLALLHSAGIPYETLSSKMGPEELRKHLETNYGVFRVTRLMAVAA